MNAIIASATQQFRTSIGRPMFRFCVLAQPIIFGLLLGMIYLERSEMDFTLYAVFGSGLSTFWSSICFSSASDIHRERWYGTLETIYAAPAGFKWIVLGKIIGNSVWGFLSICLSFSVVALVFQKSIIVDNILWLVIGLALMAIARGHRLPLCGALYIVPKRKGSYEFYGVPNLHFMRHIISTGATTGYTSNFLIRTIPDMGSENHTLRCMGWIMGGRVALYRGPHCINLGLYRIIADHVQ
jgi:hypothetical protein